MTARTGEVGRETVVLGRVGAPLGVQGWVRIHSYTDPPEGIANYAALELARGADVRRVRVLETKRAGQGMAVRLEGIETREAAQMLSGAEVRVDRSELPDPGPGTYYWHDLIGLEASNRDGQRLGRVEEILELPAHPVIVLRGDRERLVPLVRERLVAVDLAGGRVTLDWHPDD